MDRYENGLRQMCMQCKTKRNNCDKKKCNRYQAYRELKRFREIMIEIYGHELREIDKNYEVNEEEREILERIVGK